MRTIFIGLGLLFSLIYSAQGQDYAAESVLNSGSWYKIEIPESGIYKLDQAFFNNSGISTSGIDPRNIRIFGNGGGALPQRNNAFRHDDLVENAIYVKGEDDGTFGADDYVLFYAEGAHVWQRNDAKNAYSRNYNLYADTNFYFLQVANIPGKRMEEIPSVTGGTVQVSQSKDWRFHEYESENLIKSGRHWLGEKFDLTTERTYAFHIPDASSSGEIRIKVRVAARSDISTNFQVSAGGNSLGSIGIPSVAIANSEARHYNARVQTYNISPSLVGAGDSLRIELSYSKGTSNRSEGWLDWIEVDYDQELNTRNAAAWYFSLTDNLSSGVIADFTIANGSSAYQIWDITDPTSVQRRAFTLSGNNMSFGIEASEARRFVAVKAGTHTPSTAEKINNQNLHGMNLVDYLIISAPEFVSEAQRLADFHREHYKRSTAVVTPQTIFNEFSSGRQDVSAIRDFIRMLYVRSGGISPGFVTMFGDGSYVYKYISKNVNNSANFLLTYQSRDSWEPTDSYTSDDFFVILEDEEGYWGENSGIDGDNQYEVNTIDVPIGRLPIENKEQATGIVDKIIRYATNEDGHGLGDWRNRVLLVADHKEGEGNTHVRQANGYSGLINGSNPCINLEKIYMDNYEMVTTGGLSRFPEGRKALLDALDQGSLIVNYTGHGGEYAWSNSRILEVPDIESMQNSDRLPIVITATCEFGRWDDYERRSGAEIMTMNPETGAIALFTTVRLVYSSPNETLNQNFYANIFKYDSLAARMPTLGEVMMRTKNSTFVRGNLANINSRNFSLLGDPGLILNYPQYKARITSLNDREVLPGQQDTLRSLGIVRVKGLIEDELGNPITDFNGEMDVTVFDKPSLFTTRLSSYSFLWQKNRIFNGRAEVKDGTFDFEFIVPIDISYEEGSGKISLYFFNETTDGAGCYDNLFVGGTDPDAVFDDEGPEVALYINDDKWLSGGTTGKDALLYAVVSDESGINTVGTGIGHEITAVLDGDEAATLILNDFYSAKLNSFKEGTVSYPMRDLEEGEHTLSIRVWDVANNFAEASTKFIVADDAKLALAYLINAPNPFSGSTRFMVGHNQAGKDLSLELDVYTVDGRIVKRFQADFTATGNNFQEFDWDGTTDAGIPLSSGLYIYKAKLTDVETGQQVRDVSRLVLINE